MLLGFSLWICYPLYHVISWFNSKLNCGKSYKSHHISNSLHEPFIKHKHLTSKQLDGKDLLIVGDVHGCYHEMQMILSKARSHTSKPLLVIFAGDMLRKGPKNLEVMEYIRSNCKTVFCVRGNHEQSILKKIDESEKRLSEDDAWLRTLESSDIDFLRDLPYTITIPDLKITVVHAGLVPDTPMHLQANSVMLNMRSLEIKEDIFHGHVWNPTNNGKVGVPWASLWTGPNHVYFGHDAQRKLQFYEFATGLDSGCVYGGYLSSVLISLVTTSTGKMVIKSKELIRINSVDTYLIPTS